MSEKNDGGPAFPARGKHDQEYPDEVWVALNHPGMTLRDYFAAKALPSCFTVFPPSATEAAHAAYRIADAMLKAREQ